MSSPIMEMMMLKEMMGKDRNLLQDIDEFEKWMKARKEKEKTTPKPSTFSFAQTVLIVMGSSIPIAMLSALLYEHLGELILIQLQHLLDVVRTLH